MNRAGKVYYQETLAGRVWQDDTAYFFAYDKDYLAAKRPPVSLTLPLREEVYESQMMIPFFDGLIPEGWLLEAAVDNWKINPRDRMGLLLATCRDCIGAVSIIAEEQNNDNNE